jgi:hypothetical protein
VFLGEGGRSQVRHYLLAKLLPELFGDPVPRQVKAAKKIVSPKAISLINRRLTEAFSPASGELHLPGLTLTRDDLFELLVLVHEQLLGDDHFPEPPPPPPPPSPIAATTLTATSPKSTTEETTSKVIATISTSGTRPLRSGFGIPTISAIV